jgi:hypothetical protein
MRGGSLPSPAGSGDDGERALKQFGENIRC